MCIEISPRERETFTKSNLASGTSARSRLDAVPFLHDQIQTLGFYVSKPGYDYEALHKSKQTHTQETKEEHTWL